MSQDQEINQEKSGNENLAKNDERILNRNNITTEKSQAKREG